jgi:hypothetical protein
MKLSRFFSLEEMTRSDTAIRENIPNEPSESEIQSLRALCIAVLDPLREALGMSIRVNSGYRSPALNARIGGAAKKSQHMEGKAADIQAPGMSVVEVFKTIIRMQLPFDQVIYEAKDRTTKWVHVSHDPARGRREIRVAEFGADGKPTGYPVFTVEAALALAEPALRSRAPVEHEYVELGDEPEDADGMPGATKTRHPARKRTSRSPAIRTGRPRRKATKAARSKAPGRKKVRKTSKSTPKKKRSAKAGRSKTRRR